MIIKKVRACGFQRLFEGYKDAAKLNKAGFGSDFGKYIQHAMLSIELEPGTRSESVPHEDGTEEFVLVFEGALRLTVDGVEYVVEAGEGIRYLANKPHIYECHGTQKTKICMVIYYDK